MSEDKDTIAAEAQQLAMGEQALIAEAGQLQGAMQGVQQQLANGEIDAGEAANLKFDIAQRYQQLQAAGMQFGAARQNLTKRALERNQKAVESEVPEYQNETLRNGVTDYMRSQGYTAAQVEQMTPRDWKVALRAMRAEQGNAPMPASEVERRVSKVNDVPVAEGEVDPAFAKYGVRNREEFMSGVEDIKLDPNRGMPRPNFSRARQQPTASFEQEFKKLEKESRKAVDPRTGRSLTKEQREIYVLTGGMMPGDGRKRR